MSDRSSSELWTPDHWRPLAGCRQWLVQQTPNGPRLSPLAAPGVWPADEDMIATCEKAHHDEEEFPPAEGCMCGIWAFHSPLGILRWHQVLEGPATVSGLVSGWGKILPFSNGWRAECARVEAIFDHSLLDTPLLATKQAIAEAYGADIIPPTEYDEYCLERGFDLMEDDGT